MSNNQMVGMLLLGLAVGTFIPKVLPEPASVLNPFMQFLGFLFLAVAIIVFIKG